MSLSLAPAPDVSASRVTTAWPGLSSSTGLRRLRASGRARRAAARARGPARSRRPRGRRGFRPAGRRRRTSATASPSVSLTKASSGRDRAAITSAAAWPPPPSASGTVAMSAAPCVTDLNGLPSKPDRRLHPERVDGVGQQQHLDAARPEAFQMRAGLQPRGVVAHEVPDRRLVRAQSGHDVGFSERPPSGCVEVAKRAMLVERVAALDSPRRALP